MTFWEDRTVTHACAACGASFEARSQAAKFCSDRCRKRVSRAGKSGATAPIPLPSEPSAFSLVQQTRAELEAAGLAESSAGVAALILAERIDARQDTGSAVAALVREHRAVLSELLATQQQAADPFDELRALRERRRAV